MFERLLLTGLIVIPAAVIAWFVVSLIRFLRTPKEDELNKRSRRTMLVLSSVVLGTLVAAFAALAIVLSLAIIYM